MKVAVCSAVNTSETMSDRIQKPHAYGRPNADVDEEEETWRSHRLSIKHC